MAAVLPNPVRMKIGKPSEYVLKRQGQIMNLMGKIRREDYDRKSEEKRNKKKN